MGDQHGVLVAGGGIPGLALALALKHALGANQSVVVCDPRVCTHTQSGRATAIAAGPRRMLEALGTWPIIAPQAQPIHKMLITDSRLGDGVRPTYLKFGGPNASNEPFAHMVEDDHLTQALCASAQTSGVTLIAAAIEDATFLDGSVEVTLGDGRRLCGAILVAADGARSKLRNKAKLPVVAWPYAQAGIVATLSHQNENEGVAEEHFLPDGPFAVLPLVKNRISIVWTLGIAEAGKAANLPDGQFVDQVQRRMGFHLGDMVLVGRPRIFPLQLQLARSLVAPRFAVVGDAAHVIHPIAGQGLNLGLRDVAMLAELICGQVHLGLDIGASDMLANYQRQRRFDTVRMAATTDVLNRLFSNDFSPLRLARDFGLGVVERLPWVKRSLIAQASGIQQGHGRLMQGIWP